MALMFLKIIKFLCGTLWLLPLIAYAECELDGLSLYTVFKQYREQVNTATRLEQLTPYFSTVFNNYYTGKLASSSNKTRHLTHYWDNLNTAQDIVIVYEYTVHCINKNKDQATLTLLAILDQPLSLQQSPSQQQVDLWAVKIYYVKEEQHWLIDSFEYNKSRSDKTFKEHQIIDNFAVIR